MESETKLLRGSSSNASGTSDLYTVTLPPVSINFPESESGGSLDDGELSRLINFGDGDTEQCKSIHPAEFLDLRSSCNINEERFMKSVKSSVNWDAKGGKSSALFYKSRDGMIIIKEMSFTDYKCFVDRMCPEYFKHMKEAISSPDNNRTLLVKIFAVYEVKNSMGTTYYLMVMENLATGDFTDNKYDLKGKVDRSGGPDVGFEEEFLKESYMLSEPSKGLMLGALTNATSFLEGCGTMDYSLVVAVNKDTRQMMVGIIDYLGPYNTKKKLEWFAKFLMLACVCSNLSPTVLKPTSYKKRFDNFMIDHFTTRASEASTT